MTQFKRDEDNLLIPLLKKLGLQVEIAPLSMFQKPQSKFLTNANIMHVVSQIRSFGDDEFNARDPLFSFSFHSVKTFEPSTASENYYARPKDIKDVNKIKIEIKFMLEKSSKDIVKHLGSIGSSIEEHILNKYTEIIDVDYQRKQVYFKIKTGIEKNDGTGLYERFIIIGKFDSTNYGFIFDMNSYTQTPPKSIEDMYKSTTPSICKNKCKASQSGGGIKYQDNKDIGIKRIGFDGFILSNTDNKHRLKRNRRYRRDITEDYGSAVALRTPVNKTYGLYFTSTKYNSGKFDIGFYDFDTTRSGKYQVGKAFDCYTTELVQEISS